MCLRRQVFKRAKEAGLCAEKGIDNEMLDVHSYTYGKSIKKKLNKITVVILSVRRYMF